MGEREMHPGTFFAIDLLNNFLFSFLVFLITAQIKSRAMVIVQLLGSIGLQT